MVRRGDEPGSSIGRARRAAEGHRPFWRQAAIGLAELFVQCHQYTSAEGLSIADHWSSICRPIIGKVPTKISNVSSQIIKHRSGSRRDRETRVRD